jgi:SNF2 family DNA or RNA helicase
MGLGKTWMTIGLLLNAVVPNTLLLVPPVLQPQWSEALTQSGIAHRILAPGKGADGKPGSCWRDIVPAGARSGISVAIATYDRAAHNREFLMDVPFDRIVCDEGHIFKNGPTTKRFHELVQIPAERRWILSGTPVQNTKYDLTNLLRFLGMGADERIKVPLDVVAKEVLLRRIVSEVREAVPTMPTVKPTHVVHPVTMPEGEEAAVFASLVGRFEHAIESNARTNVVLELYLRIRQFLAHPAIYVDAMKRKYGEGYKRESWTGTASKMDEFRRFLLTSENRPTIVFGTFKGELDLAEVALTGAGYNVWSIRGGMSDSQRERVTEDSRKAVDEGKRVAIVIQIVAGGAGLNLQHCNRIVFLSSHWNPAIVDQAIARAYRMGQCGQVEVHHLLLADGAERNLDRYMAKKHGTKRDIAMKIHDKLFCDSAANVKDILTTLDEEIGCVVEPDNE